MRTSHHASSSDGGLVENLALRQQLGNLRRSSPRPRLRFARKTAPSPSVAAVTPAARNDCSRAAGRRAGEGPPYSAWTWTASPPNEGPEFREGWKESAKTLERRGRAARNDLRHWSRTTPRDSPACSHCILGTGAGRMGLSARSGRTHLGQCDHRARKWSSTAALSGHPRPGSAAPPRCRCSPWAGPGHSLRQWWPRHAAWPLASMPGSEP